MVGEGDVAGSAGWCNARLVWVGCDLGTRFLQRKRVDVFKDFGARMGLWIWGSFLSCACAFCEALRFLKSKRVKVFKDFVSPQAGAQTLLFRFGHNRTAQTVGTGAQPGKTCINLRL